MSDGAAPSFRRVVAVVDGPNPSFDYYLAPRLAAAGLPWRLADLRRPASTPRAALADALLLLCRYATPGWLDRAERDAAAVALFLDDDMATLHEDADTPRRYRRKLRRFGLAHWPRLGRSLNRLIVSTSVLAEQFADTSPIVIDPLAGAMDLAPVPDSVRSVSVAFHATAVHAAEHRWLAPVVKALLADVPDLCVEVVADGAAARLWRGDPRVRVLAQTAWPDYRRRTAATRVGLMLAPLLPTPANMARAPVKRIDAARCGAALLVSEPRLYGVSKHEAALGMVQPLDPAVWTSAIGALIRDMDRLEALAALNREALLIARREARPLFVPAERDGWWTLA